MCATAREEFSDAARGANLQARGNDDDMEKQTDPRNTHGGGDVLPQFFASAWRLIAGIAGGAISRDGWSGGDFRVCVCESEVVGRAERLARPGTGFRRERNE